LSADKASEGIVGEAGGTSLGIALAEAVATAVIGVGYQRELLTAGIFSFDLVQLFIRIIM